MFVSVLRVYLAKKKQTLVHSWILTSRQPQRVTSEHWRWRRKRSHKGRKKYDHKKIVRRKRSEGIISFLSLFLFQEVLEETWAFSWVPACSLLEKSWNCWWFWSSRVSGDSHWPCHANVPPLPVEILGSKSCTNWPVNDRLKKLQGPINERRNRTDQWTTS